MRIVLSLIAFLFLTSCAATGPTYSEQNSGGPELKPEPGKALVYVYRVSNYVGSGLSAPVLDNGKQVGSLNIGGYITLQVDPGFHEFRTDLYVVDEPTTIQIMEGETYYLKVFVEGFWRVVFQMQRVPEAEALPELSEMRYQGD